MARAKRGYEKVAVDKEFVLWHDSEAEVIAEAKTMGFNGAEYIILGDDMYFTAKATVVNGKIVRYGIYDRDEMVGNCGDYTSAVLYIKGKDVNEDY